MNVKSAGIIPVCVFVVCVFAAALLCLTADGAPALRIGELPDPADAVEEFFDSYKAGNFEAMDSMLCGYETLGMSREFESDFSAGMFDLARENFSCEIGECEITGNRATVSVTATFLDIPGSSEALHDMVNEEMLEALRHPPEGVDVNTQDDAYYRLLVLPSLKIAVERLGDSAEEHLTTRDIELELEYSDRAWRVRPDDELKDLLLGGAA